MRNAIILHGLAGEKEYYNGKYPSSSNSHWLPWLQKQLLINDIKADTPEIPRPFDADWDSWVREVERFDISADTSLVGHSMGGGFWVRYLSEHPEVHIDKLVLVAPWINIDRTYDTTFFDFELDTELTDRVNEVILFASDNDEPSVQRSVEFIREQLPAVTYRTFHEYGHFTMKSTQTEAFPELLEVIISYSAKQ